MKNLKIGAVSYFVLIVVLLILGGGYYFFSKKDIENSSAQYIIYKNSITGYGLTLPASWKVRDENTNIWVFPKINTGDSIDALYLNNQVGMTITMLTPSSKAKLDDFYSRFYKNFEIETFSPKSDVILEIKSKALDIEDVDHPAYGYQGQQYAIKTDKHVYQVNIFYKDAKYADEQKSNIAKIIETLKED